VLAQECHQLVPQQPLTGNGALLCSEDPGLQLLELRGDVALGVGQGLASLVGVGNSIEVGLADLDVVAEYLVVADLQRADAGALPLGALDPGEQLFAAARQLALLVELTVPARPDGASPHGRGRILGEALLQNGRQVSEGIEAIGNAAKQRRRCLVDRRQNAGQPVHRRVQTPQLPGRHQRQAHTRGESLEIRQVLQGRAETLEQGRVLHQLGDGAMAIADGLEVDAGTHQPVSQEPRAHPGQRVVEHGHEAATMCAVA